MNRLFVLLLALGACALAKDDDKVSTKDLCAKYSECLDQAQTKFDECAKEKKDDGEKEGKDCQEAASLHKEIDKLHQEKNKKQLACIKKKAADVEDLTGKKGKKCAKAAKKLLGTKQDSSEEDSSENDSHSVVKRSGHRNAKHGKKGSCTREAWKLKHRCVRFAKCCPVAKECHEQSNDPKFDGLKKKLKEAVGKCKKGEKEEDEEEEPKDKKEEKKKPSEDKEQKKGEDQPKGEQKEQKKDEKESSKEVNLEEGEKKKEEEDKGETKDKKKSGHKKN